MIGFGASAETYFKFRISIGFSVRPGVLLGLSSTERLPKANCSLVPAFRRDNPINVKERFTVLVSSASC
jgi:hypothetical protein